MSLKSTPSGHFVSLQYLRGIAALSVVYFHAVVQVGQVTGIRRLPMSGSFGVDIFFVLSGFVMWWTTKDRTVSVSDFIIKRIIRIGPLYWILTIAAAAFAFGFGNLLRSTKFDPAHVIYSLLFLPYWNPAVSINHSEALSPVIVPGWTLNTEMMFYIVFALALFAPQSRRPWIVAVLLAILYISAETWLSGTTARFYGTDRFAEFLGGVCLACGMRRIPAFSNMVWAVAAVAAFAVMFWMDYDRPSVAKIIVLGIPALLLLCSALQIELSGKLPVIPVLSRLGDASYSIYLSHIFVIAGLRIFDHIIGLEMNLENGVIFVVMALVGSGIIGFAVHRMLELPLLRGANALVRRGRRPPAAAEFSSR